MAPSPHEKGVAILQSGPEKRLLLNGQDCANCGLMHRSKKRTIRSPRRRGRAASESNACTGNSAGFAPSEYSIDVI
jgi:hypothetical protein